MPRLNIPSTQWRNDSLEFLWSLWLRLPCSAVLRGDGAPSPLSFFIFCAFIKVLWDDCLVAELFVLKKWIAKWMNE